MAASLHAKLTKIRSRKSPYNLCPIHRKRAGKQTLRSLPCGRRRPNFKDHESTFLKYSSATGMARVPCWSQLPPQCGGWVYWLKDERRKGHCRDRIAGEVVRGPGYQASERQ